MKAPDLKQLLRLFTMTDDVGRGIIGVKIENCEKEGMVRATATNKAILTEMVFSDPTLFNQLKTSPRILPTAGVDHLKAYLQEFQPKCIPASKIIEGSVDFSGWPEVDEYVASNYRRNHTVKVCLNLKFLTLLMRVMKPEKGKHREKFILELGAGEMDAIVLTNSEGDKGLIMPCERPEERQ